MKLFSQIYQKVMSRLESELPHWLFYHSPCHTENVLKKAIFIAHKEDVPKQDLFLLKVAALYHDTGFTVNKENHEEISCEIATTELKDFGLTEDQIDLICGIIRATRIPQQPKTKLEMILADADLEYLGTEDFKFYGDKLYKELLHYQPDLSLAKWNEIQFNFLSNHTYHTNYCKLHREPQKIKNSQLLRDKIDYTSTKKI